MDRQPEATLQTRIRTCLRELWEVEQSDIAIAATAGVFLACFCPPLTELGWTRRPTQFNAGFLLLILTTATSVGLCLGAFRFTTKHRWIYLIALIISGAKLAILLQMFRLIGL